jgi:chemotaxis protein CheD
MHQQDPMYQQDKVTEIFLQPGELCFGNRHTRIRTVLGSCVSLVFWHQGLLAGGMCHYMLPSRSYERRAASVMPLDGRYADEAMERMAIEIDAAGAPRREYQVKLFGGGNMFPGIARPETGKVGEKNVSVARELIAKHGFDCVSEHVEGSGHRNLSFEIWSGVVSVRHMPLPFIPVMPVKSGSNGITERTGLPLCRDMRVSHALPPANYPKQFDY